MLRQVDPRLSLHYWNFNEDPAALFTSSFMDQGGAAGNPGSLPASMIRMQELRGTRKTVMLQVVRLPTLLPILAAVFPQEPCCR